VSGLQRGHGGELSEEQAELCRHHLDGSIRVRAVVRLVLDGAAYRGTSLIRKCPTPSDPPWILGTGLR